MLFYRISAILFLITLALVAVPRYLQSAGSVVAQGLKQVSVASEANTAEEYSAEQSKRMEGLHHTANTQNGNVGRSQEQSDDALAVSALTAALMFGVFATCTLALCSRWCWCCRVGNDHDLITKVNADQQ
jgi:hypothetical protein